MSKLKFTAGDINRINSLFPDDDPLFFIEGNTFREATADFSQRLHAKALELGYQHKENAEFIDSLRETERLDVDIVSGITPDALGEKLDRELYNFFYVIYTASYTKYFEHFTIFNVAQYLSKTPDDVKHLLKELLDYKFITVKIVEDK